MKNESTGGGGKSKKNKNKNNKQQTSSSSPLQAEQQSEQVETNVINSDNNNEVVVESSLMSEALADAVDDDIQPQRQQHQVEEEVEVSEDALSSSPPSQPFTVAGGSGGGGKKNKKNRVSDHNNNSSAGCSSSSASISGGDDTGGSNNNLEEVDLNQMSELDDDVTSSTTPPTSSSSVGTKYVNNTMSNPMNNSRNHVVNNLVDNVNINKQTGGLGSGVVGVGFLQQQNNNNYTTNRGANKIESMEEEKKSTMMRQQQQQQIYSTMQSAKLNNNINSSANNLYPSLPSSSSNNSTSADYSAFVNSAPSGGGLSTGMSSLHLDKQSMLVPQSLDNNALLQRLVVDSCSHLILDDNETLQVNSAQDFIALFKSATTGNQSSSTSVGGGGGGGSANASPRGADSTTGITTTQPQGSMMVPVSSGGGHHSPSAASSTSSDDKLVKCVAIFGNTGDGKSHTLNHTFFNGRSIFRTSHKQETCTMGVWCAYDPVTNALILDTEGLLGTTSNENKRMRLLLKVLAISDVIIYRTRAERLHNDLFKFLSDASQAYNKYFSKELKQAAAKLKLDTISSLGPDCVIFHETQHTETLCDETDSEGHLRTVAHQLRDRFAKLDYSYDSYSSVEYVGTRTSTTQSGGLIGAVPLSTDFRQLAQTVRSLLKNNSVRPPRKLSSVYHVFKVLNDKFNGVITKNQISTFADEYFTCSALCLACGKRCQHSINHLKDGVLHGCGEKCHYDHQYDNRVYVCKLCHEAGKEVVVLPKTAATTDNSFIGIVKYTYSGYVLECPHHGIIYRSRQYWYGNPEPESVVRTELKHIWPGQQNNVGTSHNLSRKIIDNVSYLSESLQSVSAKPTMYAKQWIADRVAPAYWVPNSDIQDCYKCRKPFNNLVEKKHHCRGCGRGFCDKCSAKRRIIPWWSLADKVRVCESCYEKPVIEEPKVTFTNQLTGAITAASASNTSVNNSDTSNNSPNHTPPHHHYLASAAAGSSFGGSSNSLNSLVAANGGASSSSNDLMVRKVTETVQETISLLGYATKYPLDILKESARPAYWRPDSECLRCALCSRLFDPERGLPLHHCRSCGLGVCHTCSPHQRPVPARGWDTPVRVCNNCVTILTPSDLLMSTTNSSLSNSDNNNS